MHRQYIFHGKDKEHPFHVKSNWEPPVQPSVALKTYLEEVKLQLANINTINKYIPLTEIIANAHVSQMLWSTSTDIPQDFTFLTFKVTSFIGQKALQVWSFQFVVGLFQSFNG